MAFPEPRYAGDVVWYYRPIGKGQIADIVSHQPGIHMELARHAQVIAARARWHLAVHRDTGYSHIVVYRKKLDWYVELVDESAESASSIEMGWHRRNAGHRALDILHDSMGGV